MTGDVADPMAAEFGTVAEWTAQVAADLGPEYFVPAGCRRRFGPTPQLSAATEQSDRIGHLLASGQLTSQVILLRPE